MTTLTQALNTATCRVCDAVAAWSKRALHRIQYNRQMAANRRVAADLIHLGFHNQKEYNQILTNMNDKTINEYHTKF
tara:strand:+ start:814 stop:1044 length:231 start_codon:yes stop_codon:yes gene_type:complete